MERRFAEARGLAVGDRIEVAPADLSVACAARVAGIFEPRPDPARLTLERPRFVFHLSDLATLSGRPDAADRITLELAPGVEPASVAASLAPRMPGTAVLETTDVTERQSTTFTVVERFHGAIAFITLVAGSVFLACIMFLKVGERRPAVAALRLMGVSKRTLALWIFAEATFVAVVGTAVGIGLGAIASGIINAYYQRVYDTELVFSMVSGDIIAEAVALAIGLGAVAGATALVDLFRRDPLEEAGR